MDLDLPQEIHTRTLRRLAAIHKKELDWNQALLIWEEMADGGDIAACIELAKYYEHTIRDYPEAIRWTLIAMNLFDHRQGSWLEFSGDDLKKRYDRILKKMDNSSRRNIMVKTIPLPSKLRREIISLVKLNPKMDPMQNRDILDEKITQAILEIVDLACSFLQGAKPSDETNKRFDSVWNELGKIYHLPGLSQQQQQIISQIMRHFEEIRNVCQDPLLQMELQKVKVGVPSYSQFTETVFQANGQLMAESTRLFLESFGIQSILGRESAGVVYGLTVGPLGEVDTRVIPENAVDSRILLDAMNKGYFILENDVEILGENLSINDPSGKQDKDVSSNLNVDESKV